MKTLHVVGYKNSGKTTLIARWVRLLKDKGFSVAVLKHHGHGGQPAMPDSATDTMQFFDSGADVSIVAGGGVVQLLLNEEPEFAELKKWQQSENRIFYSLKGIRRTRGESGSPKGCGRLGVAERIGWHSARHRESRKSNWYFTY